LPARALESFFDLLKPSLGPAADSHQDRESRAQAYCKLYGVPQADLGAALRGCLFLLTRASQVALPAEAFRQDLEALSTENTAVIDVVMAGYEEARTLIRLEMAKGTLFDHGKVLVGVDWRLDMVHASDRGANLGLPVALLTLRFSDGQPEQGREERVTMYAIPEMVKQLRAALEKLDRAMSPPQGRHTTRDELARQQRDESGSDA
jgi:hypothetical protein